MVFFYQIHIMAQCALQNKVLYVLTVSYYCRSFLSFRLLLDHGDCGGPTSTLHNMRDVTDQWSQSDRISTTRKLSTSSSLVITVLQALLCYSVKRFCNSMVISEFVSTPYLFSLSCSFLGFRSKQGTHVSSSSVRLSDVSVHLRFSSETT